MLRPTDYGGSRQLFNGGACYPALWFFVHSEFRPPGRNAPANQGLCYPENARVRGENGWGAGAAHRRIGSRVFGAGR